MNKLIGYLMGVLILLSKACCYAYDKFEILPDLPDPLAQQAVASAVSKNADTISVLGNQTVGHEPSIISVIFTLLFVILLIYITGILYIKLNKINLKTMKQQQGDISKNKPLVVSTTPLGNNKTLHVVELDGKRMLIGASSGAIQLIKDLGSIEKDVSEEEFSHIEIPNIKIPKIEIPKIEIPTIGFSKFVTKVSKTLSNTETHSENSEIENIDTTEQKEEVEYNSAEEQNPEEIIDSLFAEQQEEKTTEIQEEQENNHVVDPDEYMLYRKYL